MKKYVIAAASALLFSTMALAAKPTITYKFNYEFSPSAYSPVKKCVYTADKYVNGRWVASFPKYVTVSKNAACPKANILN